MGIVTTALIVGIRKMHWSRWLMVLPIVLVPGFGVSTWTGDTGSVWRTAGKGSGTGLWKQTRKDAGSIGRVSSMSEQKGEKYAGKNA